MKRSSLFFASVLFAGCLVVAAEGQHRPRFATRPVNIYLWSINEKGSHDISELVPVQRRVQRMLPARGAIEALLAGPTEEEKSNGLRAPHTEGLKIKELTISNGLARISLVSDCPTCAHWTEPAAPLRLKEAIELTLKQFDTVRRVKVILDGKEDVKQW